MADPKSTIPNGLPSASTNVVPTGTASQQESHILQTLRAINPKNLETLADVTLTGVDGDPVDDHTYLMEHVIELTAELPVNDRVCLP